MYYDVDYKLGEKLYNNIDAYKDVHENSSTGPLSCVSSTGDPTYDTAIAAGTQCHNMVRTKMT